MLKENGMDQKVAGLDVKVGILHESIKDWRKEIRDDIHLLHKKIDELNTRFERCPVHDHLIGQHSELIGSIGKRVRTLEDFRSDVRGRAAVISVAIALLVSLAFMLIEKGLMGE